MILLKYTFSLILILSLSGVFSQGMFTAEPEKFLKEMTAYLGKGNKNDAKTFSKEFEPEWLEGRFTQTQQSAVYSMANAIGMKKLKIYPDFKNYMAAVLYAVQSGMNDEEFEHWHGTVEKAFKEKNRSRFTAYIQTSVLLLKNNTIYKSSSTTWQASSNKYHFTYEKEPIIVFDEMNLKCYAKNDSSVLYKTKGAYYPYKTKWTGTGGTLTWERAGLPKDKFYAEIKDYRISMKSAGYKVDSAKFYNSYFADPIYGDLSEKVLSNRGVKQVAFPKFVSYSKRLQIDDIFPDVDYNGGFTMEGADLLGAGSNGQLARLDFSYKDKHFMKVESIVFVINKDGANAEKAKIHIKLDDDSLTHPGVLFQFNNKNDEAKIVLTRGKGITAAPFMDTYHQMDIYSESLNWKMGDPVINFEPLYGSSQTSATFTSLDYFEKGEFDRLAGRSTHPVGQLRNASNSMGKEVLTLVEAATALQTSKTEAEPTLYQLMVLGYLEYDKDLGLVKLRDKLFNNVDQRSGRKDFDVLRIVSDDKQNGEISLVSYDLLLRGVSKTELSKAQFVRIYPKKKELIIKKNRDMSFGGIINTGRTEYYGSLFTFDYNDFKINLVECDSMRIRPKNQQRNPNIPLRLLSKIENISGYILIDGADNKSGKDTTFGDYPKLSCTKKSYVYYDNKSIQKGIYNREDFKFIVEPFEMDSLDNFSNEGVAFEGEFISAGIFPNMDEVLRIQPDYSLGFIRQAPKDGIGIYGDKANFNNEIRLSAQGLQGSGDIDFLSSHAESTAITFFPDSVNAVAEVYYNEPSKKTVQVPEVKGTGVYVSYIPKQKVLYASSYDGNELHMFEDSAATLDGRIALRPNGMTGEGNMFINNGEVLSNLFRYKHHVIDADTSEFKLRTVDMDEMAFKTSNVTAHIDFSTKKGEFKSNEGESMVEFPENQYICFMDQFNWLMDQDDLEMESKGRAGDLNIDTDLDLAGSNFFSVHPKQDSLSFKSPKAKFDVRKKVLTCQKVEYIETADARVFPDSGLVIIKKKARMQPFENAKIVANFITKYHNIFDAKAEIKGKKEYKASGYYNYVDESKNQQKFYFSNIRPDTSGQTIAEGAVKEEANFKLSSQFDYYGEIAMFASRKELTFRGETRLSSHSCKGIPRNWMAFEAEIDPKDIFIPVTEDLFDSKGNAVGAGLILNTDSIGLYSTFLSTKKSPRHIDVMTAHGFLKYDKKTSEYRIASRDKLIEQSLPGNYVSLNTKNCKMIGDGRFDFGCELGLVELDPIGTMEYDPEKADLKIKASMSIKFPFNDDAFSKIDKQLDDYPDLLPLDFNNSTYEKSLREIVGLAKADKIISDLNIYGKMKGKMPAEVQSQLYLADVNFIWDKEKNAYVSQGKIGVANMLKHQVFKQMDGKIAIFKRPTGDEISIVLKLDENNYYFFNYKRGLFQTFSSNEDYNNVILETKKDKTKFKAPKGKEDFQFMLGSKTKAIAFMRMFE